MNKIISLILIISFTGILLYASMDLPMRGSPDNPMNQPESMTGSEVAGHYYIEEAYRDAHTQNMVTVVLGDYRSMDTLGEQTVIFAAGIIGFLILRRRKKDKQEEQA